MTGLVCSDNGSRIQEKPIDLSVDKSACKKYVKVRNDQGHPSSTVSSPMCVVEPTSSRSIQALADIEDVYASDSEHQHEGIPNQPSVDSISRDDGSMESSMPPGIQLSVDPLLHDESSRDSTSSLSGVSSGSLSPSTKKLVRIITKIEASKDKKREKKLEKKLDMIHSSVKAMGCLASAIELKDAELKHKDAELEAQKHKTKSQEGKTAAQTKKVNIAVEEAMVARAETETERQLREKAEQLHEKVEADNSTLMITNAGMSTTMVNLTTGGQVCKSCICVLYFC